MTEATETLVVEIKNVRPVALADFTRALEAFGDQFKRYMAEQGGVEGDTRLFVHEMRAGSIIAELVSFSETVSYLTDHREYLAGFVPYWQEILEAVFSLKPEARELDKRTLRNARDFVQPTAVDVGSQTTVVANDNAQTIINNFTFNQNFAAATSHNAAHLLNSEFPDQERFTNEPMALFQLRDATTGKSGDMGQIDRYADKAKRLTFADEATKEAIIQRPENPFDCIFWVDGVVKTVAGRVAAFHITMLRDVTAKDVD